MHNQPDFAVGGVVLESYVRADGVSVIQKFDLREVSLSMTRLGEAANVAAKMILDAFAGIAPPKKLKSRSRRKW